MPRNTVGVVGVIAVFLYASMRPRRDAAEYSVNTLRLNPTTYASMRPRRDAAEYPRNLIFCTHSASVLQ